MDPGLSAGPPSQVHGTVAESWIRVVICAISEPRSTTRRPGAQPIHTTRRAPLDHGIGVEGERPGHARTPTGRGGRGGPPARSCPCRPGPHLDQLWSSDANHNCPAPGSAACEAGPQPHGPDCSWGLDAYLLHGNRTRRAQVAYSSAAGHSPDGDRLLLGRAARHSSDARLATPQARVAYSPEALRRSR